MSRYGVSPLTGVATAAIVWLLVFPNFLLLDATGPIQVLPPQRTRRAQEIDVSLMAMTCALSVRSLHRRLREEVILTPAQLLARLRMEAACVLLEQRTMTVKQAARESGYGTDLRRAFVKQLGVLPSDYQSRFAGDDSRRSERHARLELPPNS